MKKVLDVVLDPTFDPREITLRTIPDFFSALRRGREQQLDEMALRAEASIPQVIVDGVFQAIADDLDDRDSDFHAFRQAAFNITDVKRLARSAELGSTRPACPGALYSNELRGLPRRWGGREMHLQVSPSVHWSLV